MSDALRISMLPLGPIGTNCYIVASGDSDACVIIDPGADADRVRDVLAELSLTPAAILLTHTHWDHVGAVHALATHYAIDVYVHDAEHHVLADLASFAPPQYGPWESHNAEHRYADGEHLSLAGINFSVLHVPGHSPGSVGLHVVPDSGTPVMFIGDLIFKGSVGRTDLPGADANTLLDSAARVLAACSDDTVLLSGHGPATTVGDERTTNPFLVDIDRTRTMLTSEGSGA